MPDQVVTLAVKGDTSDSQGSFQAAFARTVTRALGIYFSRPVRLFRPSKISGWHLVRGLATQNGASLSPTYLTSLIKDHGFAVIPKHFVPPMVVNALLGTVLWTSYAEASTVLQPHISHPILNAAVAGGFAGGASALVSAPAENVRLLVEGGTRNSWSHAWKEVFRGTAPPSTSRHETIEEARKVKIWMKEVGEMAGRGWDGLGYTLGKDLTGFAAFFAIFEVTRRIALEIRAATSEATRSTESKVGGHESVRRHLPQLLYGATLVTGGVIAGLSYEVIGRPWDVARHAVRLDRLTAHEHHSPISVVRRKIQEEGLLSLFRDPTNKAAASASGHRRIYSVLRTVARVGPWGVGFLVYQAYDTGLVQ